MSESGLLCHFFFSPAEFWMQLMPRKTLHMATDGGRELQASSGWSAAR